MHVGRLLQQHEPLARAPDDRDAHTTTYLQKPSMQTVLPVQGWLFAPGPHSSPRLCAVPQTLYVMELLVTGLHSFKMGWEAQTFWLGASHEIQQSECKQIEPWAQETPGTPAPEPS
jgi:hypothetical protein